MRKRIFNIIEIANANDLVSRIYDIFMVTVIFCSLVPLCFKYTTYMLRWVDHICVIIFIIDYLLRWWTADYKLPGKGKWAFVRYPFTAFAIVDLLSILPSISIVNSSLKLMRLFRMTRLLRLLLINKGIRAIKLLRYSKSFQIVLNVIRRERQPLFSVCVLAVGYVFLSALVMFQVEPDSFGTFFDALYWAMVTLTTVGYGDIYPASDMGRVVSMLSSFMGIAIVALPTGIITAGFMSELNEQGDEEKKQ